MVQSVPNSPNLHAVAAGKVLPPLSTALEDAGPSHFFLQDPDGDQLVAIRLSEYFAKLAEGFGLPRALGSLFSPLFLAAGLLSFEDVVRQAGVSKASASTGLRQLRQLRAVETVFLPGDRRTYYRAETSVLRLVGGLLTGTLLTQLDSGDRLLRETANGLTRQSPPHWADRVASLQRWQHNFRELHPVLSQFGTG
jgi:DNA-binding transcriptional regulator GbsR (MarR family)